MHSGSCPAAIATADPLIGKAVWRSGPAAMLAADSRPGPRLSGKITDVHPHQKRQLRMMLWIAVRRILIQASA
jgi:hypothetical protein